MGTGRVYAMYHRYLRCVIQRSGQGITLENHERKAMLFGICRLRILSVEWLSGWGVCLGCLCERSHIDYLQRSIILSNLETVNPPLVVYHTKLSRSLE